MEFKRNRKYFSCLRETEDIGDQKKFVCDNPLFVNEDMNKGLFPVYRTGGRQGVLNKNYHELILKDISNDLKQHKEEDEFKGL